MQRPCVWAFLPLLLLNPSSSFGQGSIKKTLSGYIREEGSGHLISEARVELQNALGSPLASAYSDRNGGYEFEDVGNTDFYLVAQHEGYAAIREFVRQEGAGHIYKDVFLRPLSPESAAKSVNPISEHQLSIPQKARESFEKGIQLVIQKSDYRGAVAQFARAISQYPSYYEAYAAMGLARYKLGDATAAEAAYRKSIELSAEKYPQAMIDLAAMFNGLNRYSEAEPLLRKVIALDASSWRGQYELAVALVGLKRLTEAETSAAAARDLKPDNPQVYLMLYNLHIQGDDFPAALRDTDAYLKLVPDGPMADRVRRMRAQIQKAPQSAPTAPPQPPVGTQDISPAASGDASTGTKTSLPLNGKSVIPPRVDEIVPAVAVDKPCPLFLVLQGAEQRAEQLLSSLQRFNAAERVEHYRVNAAGIRGAPDVRSFDYVVSVSHDSQGGFNLQEYRNGGIVGPQQFPSGIRTANLSVHALIFHPVLAPGFNFACEGLGEWKGRPAWLVHFDTKPDQLNPFRSYEIGGFSYPVLLTGRAWIDARTYQVVRLESDLIKPVEKIHLTREHISIDYAQVQFRTNNQQLWLPQTAELYVELDGRRFYRRHTFSDFKIFSTDSTQEVHAPKESYCFTNTSGVPISGVLKATPVQGTAFQPASIKLTIPAKGTVCKSVGPGQDVNIPVPSLASATFAHDGPEGSVEADAYLLNGSALELIPNSNVPVSRNP